MPLGRGGELFGYCVLRNPMPLGGSASIAKAISYHREV